MKLTYTLNDHKHRVFTGPDGREWRGFWQSLGHKWVVFPSVDRQPTVPLDDWQERRKFPNWTAVERWAGTR